MGLFSGIKNTYKKSEAAVIVQNLLEHQQNVGLFDSDPGPTATKLVGDIWDAKPELFNGNFGQRPHKLSVAAAALAAGLGNQWPNESSKNAVVICLGIALSEIEKNGSLYAFNGIDERLISMAISRFQEEADFDASLEAQIVESAEVDAGNEQQEYRKPTTKTEASDFIDSQITQGKMTDEQFEVICNMLSMGAMMTGNLQEAYEMVQGKPVITEKFAAWLSDDDEGRWWHAIWVILRKGQPDTEYRAP